MRSIHYPARSSRSPILLARSRGLIAAAVGFALGQAGCTESTPANLNGSAPPIGTQSDIGESGARASNPAISSGSCTQGLFYGEINGLAATAQVEMELLRQVNTLEDPRNWTLYGGDAYVLFSGAIRSGPYAYVFTADVYGASGFGELVSNADGSTIRIRIDLFRGGFAIATNVFEGDCGERGCAQYLFACQ